LWGISVLFFKVPKVNIRPLGENSPNLVTLLTYVQGETVGSKIMIDDFLRPTIS
jgi:hypothetical protein